ncbi:MAG: hypothetical protein ACI9FY_001076, partial [Patiriisocius sp.]
PSSRVYKFNEPVRQLLQTKHLLNVTLVRLAYQTIMS